MRPSSVRVAVTIRSRSASAPSSRSRASREVEADPRREPHKKKRESQNNEWGAGLNIPCYFPFFLTGWRLPFRRSEWLMNAFVGTSENRRHPTSGAFRPMF